MSETVNQGNTPAEEEKLFSQSEMNAIVQERLARERSKYAGFEEYKEKAAKFDEAEEASKSELQKATERANALQAQLDRMNAENTLRAIREAVASEKGIPLALLTAENEEACRAQADAILQFAGKREYPVVQDGGEVSKAGTKKSTAELFSDWCDSNFK